MALGVTLAVVWGAVFLVMPAHAFFNDTNTNGIAGGSSTVNGDAEGRGVATFSMNFSASSNMKGNFDADAEGDMQNMFSGEDKPAYYYRPETYTK